MRAVQSFHALVASRTGRPHFDMVDAMVDDPDRAPGLMRQFEAAAAEAEERARQPQPR